jgi:hypothetical protein
VLLISNKRCGVQHLRRRDGYFLRVTSEGACGAQSGAPPFVVGGLTENVVPLVVRLSYSANQ